MPKHITALIVIAAMFTTLPAWAHSKVASSEPTAGSTVTAPKTLSVTFTRELRLVMLKLTADGKDDVVVPVDSAAAATKSFSFPLPALAPATYTVRWRGTGEDGHIMNGTFSFTVAGG